MAQTGNYQSPKPQRMANLMGPNSPQLTADDFPLPHEDIDVINKPIHYVGLRIKALIKRELDELAKMGDPNKSKKEKTMTRYSNEESSSAILFDPDLGRPTEGGRAKQKPFSQETFSIGSGMKMSVMTGLRQRWTDKLNLKIKALVDGEVLRYLPDKDFTAKEMKQALYGTGSNKEQNEIVERWFKRETINIKKAASKQNRQWNKAASKDKNFLAKKEGLESLRKDIFQGNDQVTKTRRGISLFENQNYKERLLQDTNAPIFMEDNQIRTLRKVIVETERAKVFDTIKQREQQEFPETINEQEDNSQTPLSVTWDNNDLDLETDEALINPNKLQAFREQRLRRNAKTITFPQNPVLYQKVSKAVKPNIALSPQQVCPTSKVNGFFSPQNLPSSNQDLFNDQIDQKNFSNKMNNNSQTPNRGRNTQPSGAMTPSINHAKKLELRPITEQGGKRLRGHKNSVGMQHIKKVPFMDDFCHQKEVFFNQQDRQNYKVFKSKSQFGLYSQTIQGVFKSDFKDPFDIKCEKYLQMFKKEKNEDPNNQTSQQSSRQVDKKLLKQNAVQHKNNETHLNVKKQSTISKYSVGNPNAVNHQSDMTVLQPVTQDSFKKQESVIQSMEDSEDEEERIKKEKAERNRIAQAKIRAYMNVQNAYFRELEQLQTKIREDKIIRPEKEKHEEKQEAAVSKLSKKVSQFKKIHHKKEEKLNSTLEKNSLDQYILLKEKIESVWNKQLFNHSGPQKLKIDIKLKKIKRSQLQRGQIDAYQKILEFIKIREDQTPVAEEKMLLDGIKIVLDNGWTIRTEEIIILFDLCGLKSKVFIGPEHTKFLEFIYVVVELFGLDQEQVQNYFTIKN